MHASIVTVAVFFVFGICLGRRLPLAPDPSTFLFLATFGAVLLHRKRADARARTWALLLLVTIAAMHRVHLALPGLQSDHVFQLLGAPVATYRLLVVGGDASPLRPGQARVLRAELRLFDGRGERSWRERSGTLEAAWHGSSQPRLALGTLLEGRGGVVDLGDGQGGGSEVHGGREWTARMRLAFRPVGRLRVLGKSPVAFERRLGTAMREKASRIVGTVFAVESAPVVRAMLLGERGDLDEGTKRAFRRSGTLHLLSQSGLHVGVLALAVYGTARILRLGLGPASVVTAVFLLLFVMMVGGKVPVLRATIMALLMLGGRIFRRPASPYAAMAVAALLLLVWDPLALFEAGFQLSFLAVLSILYLWPILSHWLRWVPGVGNALLSVSLAAWLGTAPILLYHGGEISLIAPLANVVLVPLAGVTLPCMLLAVVTALVNPWIGFFFAAAAHGFLQILLRCAEVAAAPDWAFVQDLDVAAPWLLLYYAALIGLGDAPGLLDAGKRFFASPWRGGRGPDLRFLRPENYGGSPELARAFQRHALAVDEHLRRMEGRWHDEGMLTRERFGTLWPAFHESTRNLLVFASAFLKDEDCHDGVPALAAWMAALEGEVHRRLFHPLLRELRGRDASALPGIPEGIDPGAYADGQALLPLASQVELLWLLVTARDEEGAGWKRDLIRFIEERFTCPDFILSESRLPLRLDELHRRLTRHLRSAPSREVLTAMEMDFGCGSSAGILVSLLRCMGEASTPCKEALQDRGGSGTDSCTPEAEGEALSPVEADPVDMAGLLGEDGERDSSIPLR